MRAAIFAYSRRGCETARRVRQLLTGEGTLYAPRRLAQPDFGVLPSPAGDFYGPLFARMDALIFVGACGIAVRSVAPYVRDKTSDPAVVVLDELGTFVIPLLSGHLGGANALAELLAVQLGATAAVTTATDRNGKFSVDTWAAKNGFALSSMAAAKAVSAAILEGPVPILSDFPVRSPYPAGTCAGAAGPVGIYVGWRSRTPFGTTLQLIPKILHLGIGCRRGTGAEQIRAAAEQLLRSQNISPRAVGCAASIDLKQDEAGLLQFCREAELPVKFYTAEQLRTLPGDFTPSAFVRSVTGVDNVCERAACMGAGRLIVGKTVIGGVTVALAEEDLEVDFGNT